MPAFSCSSIHFTHFAIYRIIFGVGNFSRGFFVCSERKCSIFVSVLFCFYLLRLYIKFATSHHGRHAPACFNKGLSRLSEVTIFVTDPCMLNLVREGEEDYIEAIRYRRRLKIFENFLFFFVLSVSCWNIRFGAICHFRPTNSSSSTENLRIVFTYFAKFKSSRPFSRLHLVDFWKEFLRFP